MRIVPFTIVILASAACWGILFASFPPGRQEFPLFDDWAFARSAKIFVDGGGIDYGQWAAMPQWGMWLWSLPFVRALGPSFVVFRVSTIILSWLGLLAFANLCVHALEGQVWLAAFVTALVAFNPLFFTLSGTFMTDVPSLSMCLIALALYHRAIRGGSVWMWLGAAAASFMAVSTRQNTWTLPL